MNAEARPTRDRFGKIVAEQSQPITSMMLRAFADMTSPRVTDDPETLQAEGSLHAFARQGWHVLEPNNEFADGWHLGCIAEHLEAVSANQIRKLVVNVPPRHSKSLLACVFWFCWHWIREPSSRWLYTSYGASLSQRDSDKCRTLIKSPWYQDRWGHRFRIKPSDDRKAKFTNSREGYRIATSVGGIGTGEGGDIVVGDDPHKTDEALSKAAVSRVVRNWDGTLSTRGNNPATMRRVLVMQRLAEDDLAGHLKDRGYECLVLPAEYEPTRYFLPTPTGEDVAKPRDAITPTSLQALRPRLRDDKGGSGRANPGDPLWPSRFGPAQLAELKAELGSRQTAGQLQQRPNPDEGTIFQAAQFRYYGEASNRGTLRLTMGTSEDGQPPPASWTAAECRWFQCCDTALTDNADSAYTVVGTFFITPARQLGVWHVWRMRLQVPEQFKCLMHLRDGLGQYDAAKRRWVTPGSARPWPATLMYQAVEDKASGIGLIQQAALEGKPFRVLKAAGDKVHRAASLATMIEAGLVFFRESARKSWLVDFESELLSFPGGAYADQVDVASYAAQLVTRDALTNAPARDLVFDSPLAATADVVVVNGREVAFDEEDREWWRK